MLKIEKQKGQQEKSTICISFSKTLLFNSFAALYMSSNSVSARTGGGDVKQHLDMRGKGKEGVENWLKCADIIYR